MVDLFANCLDHPEDQRGRSFFFKLSGSSQLVKEDGLFLQILGIIRVVKDDSQFLQIVWIIPIGQRGWSIFANYMDHPDRQRGQSFFTNHMDHLNWSNRTVNFYKLPGSEGESKRMANVCKLS